MTAPVFLTGASGFVGQRLLPLLGDAGFPDVRVLLRGDAEVALPAGARAIRGSMQSVDTWSAELEGVHSIIHLASPTGKANERVYFDTIVEGTRRLLEHAERAGVRRFLFVSSCAAGFTNRRYYHYAEAKLAAEELVRQSLLDTLIVRPTMVFGRGSTVLAGLRALATLPRPVLFGSGANRVQPIAVDDLASMLASALNVPEWNDATLTAGGAETLSLDALMRRIREAVLPSSRKAHVVHLPLAPVRELLGLLEGVLLPILPLTAGQLATFANDGVGEPHPMLAQLPTARMTIAEMLASSGLRDA